MSAGAKFYFKPAEGEHIETTVSIDAEKAAAVFGTVRGMGGEVQPDALVLLFRATGELKLIDRQFTDADGQFYFGPIEGGILYLIKIYKNDVKVRELEIVAE